MPEVKERPILFSGPMVRAILEGRKTVTRRVITQATGPSLSVEMLESGQALLSWLVGHGPGYEVGEKLKFVDCPYGKPGDRLWVRETWRGVVKISPPDLPMELGVARAMCLIETSATGSNMPRRNRVVVSLGAHPSTCRAGPAPSCWRSPTCASSD